MLQWLSRVFRFVRGRSGSAGNVPYKQYKRLCEQQQGLIRQEKEVEKLVIGMNHVCRSRIKTGEYDLTKNFLIRETSVEWDDEPRKKKTRGWRNASISELLTMTGF